jgi:hypothetical protein
VPLQLPSASAAHVSAAQYQELTGRGFFPHLISGPFGHRPHLAFAMAAALYFLAAVFSWLRGRGTPPVHRSLLEETEEGLAGAGEVAMQEAGAGSPRNDRLVMTVSALLAPASVAEAMLDYQARVHQLTPLVTRAPRGGLEEPGLWPAQDVDASALVVTDRPADADQFPTPLEATGRGHH